MPPRPVPAGDPVTWTHTLTTPPPGRIPHEDGGLDEVLLEGTFNADWPPQTRGDFLAEVVRALKPGGRVLVHALVSDRPIPGTPSLPGPAAMVQTIPVETEPLEELARAGFVGLNYERFGAIHCFAVEGVELRKLQLSAFKPFGDDREETHSVLYRGPLSCLIDETGREYPRGRRVAVDEATWRLLRSPPFAEQFTCFPCVRPAL